MLLIFDGDSSGHRLHILAVDPATRCQFIVMAVAAAVLDADLAADHIIHRAIRQRVAAGIRVDAVLLTGKVNACSDTTCTKVPSPMDLLEEVDRLG